MKHRRLIPYFSIVLCFVFANISFSQFGQLDPTFGQNGIVTTEINVIDSFDVINSTAIQSDGKIVAAGYSFHGTKRSFAITRYNSNGSLDNSFGTNGIVITPIGTLNDFAESVAIQSDGKIVVAGFSQTSEISAEFALARYNPNGSLDNTFGTNGIVLTLIGDKSYANSVAIQFDGKIVAGGYYTVGIDLDIALVRYNSNGGLDNTFGTNGIVTANIGSTNSVARSVALQDDGKILLSGYTSLSIDDYDFTVIRYNPNGALDATFGTNGIVITPIDTTIDVANSVAIQSDGKIVAAGYSQNGSDYDFALARYNTNGDLDNTFGTNGILITNIGSITDVARSVVLQDDGKIVAGGYSRIGGVNEFALARYNTNGSLDNSFGTNGIVITPIGTIGDVAHSTAIQSDGKIVAAGYSWNNTNFDFAIVRYNTDGSIDNTFANFGIVITPIGPSISEAWSIIMQNDEKILAAGYSDNGSDDDFAITRYNTDGSLDNTFGTSGITTNQIGSGDDVARSLAYQDDGKIVAGGYSHNGSDYDFALVRYNTNGFIDNTFGTNGIVTTPIGSGSDYVTSLLYQSDDKFVAAGHYYNGSDYDFALVRYSTNGSLDNTFGTNGVVTTPIGPSNNRSYSSVIQDDGKILVAGYAYNGNDDDFAITRYNTNGDLDNTFGTNGIVNTPIGTTFDRAFSIAIQTDGKIVVAGYSSNGNDDDFAIARYNTSGDLDNTFGTNGILTTPVGSSNDRANSVSIQGDGKIVAVGYSNNNGNDDIAVVRYNPNGDLDNTFGVNGIKTVQVGISNDRVNSVAIQNDGNILAAGYSKSESFNYSVFTIIRCTGDFVPSVSLTVNVGNGWNMVSVPGINPSGMDVDTWWSGKDPAADVFKYSGGYQAVTTTSPTEGYWMKNSGTQVYNYTDIQVVPHSDVPLALGWNLIGLYETTISTASVTTIPPGIISTPIFEYSGGYNPATDIIPGYGYWAKADAVGSIVNLSSPPLGKRGGEVVELFPDDWGKIILTDASGINYTLYAVTGDVDLNKYELPPMPPAGMFDIRYGSGRIAEDINNSIQEIQLTGVTYPLTVRAEEMDIRLMDESGKTVNVNLKSGEDVMINNATIKKLVVSGGALVPTVYTLEQNYPNPFNPSTTIEFSLPEDISNVKLSIYNALGERVAELVNSSLTAGKYQYKWNAKNVATGMYIYELRTDKFVSVKKMLLLK